MFHVLLFFLNFWSVNANIFFGYSKLQNNQIDKTTHVKIKVENKKQHTTKRYIVPILCNAVETSSG
jgi:hypothetical protein